MKAQTAYALLVAVAITFVFALPYIILNDVLDTQVWPMWDNTTSIDYNITSTSPRTPLQVAWLSMPLLILLGTFIFVIVNTRREL